jgi:hypothetical protein
LGPALVCALVLCTFAAPASAAPDSSAVGGGRVHASADDVAAPDRGSAARLAYRTRKPVLVTSLTSETAQTWALPDGTFKTSVAAAPLRTQDVSGRWVDVDLTLERRADGSVGPRAQPGQLSLSGARSAGSDAFAAVGTGAARTSLGWVGALPEPSLDGAKATYHQVRPGVDLVVEARRTGFEFFLVVADAQAARGLAQVSMPWHTGELSAAQTDGGGLELRSGSTAMVSVPPAAMWDSIRSASGDVVRKAPVGVAATRDASGGVRMVLTPSTAFFTDPSVVYPVTVDPTVTLKPAYDAFVQNTYSSDQSGASVLKLGYSDDSSEGCGSGCTARTFINFYGLTAYSGATVRSASLYLWETWSWSCSPMQWESWRVSAVGTGTRWTNQPDWITRYGLSTMTKGYSSSCAAGSVEINVTGIFGLSTSSGWNTAQIGLKASSEGNHNSWKKFASSEVGTAAHVPYVQMVYNYTPNTPASMKVDSCYLACGSPATVRSVRPRLTATVSDKDGGTLREEFEVYNSAHTSLVAKSGTTVTGVASGAARSWQTPALTDGTTYGWRVRACDAYVCGGYTGWFTFTVDVSNPSLPVVSGTAYPPRSSGVWAGGPGQAGTFTFAPGSSDEVAAYTYQLNGGDAVTTGAGARGAEKLTANQQKVSSGTTGFTGYNATISRVTNLGHNSSDSLKVVPSATGVSCGSAGCTFASVGGDIIHGDTGLQLGMQAGHRYELSGWIYVPASTGLTYGSEEAEWQHRGLRLGGHYLVGSAYTDIYSDKPTKTDTWQRLSVTMSVPASATQAFFRLYDGFATGKTTKAVYFDDLSLVELTGSTSTVSVTPDQDGPNVLSVQARDLAGNISTDPRVYEFLVRPDGDESWLWPLDEASGSSAASVTSSSDRTPALTLSGGVTWAEDGRVGDSALTFDGTGQAVTSAPLLDTVYTGGFTVAAWVRVNADVPVTGGRTAVSQGGVNDSMFRLGYRDDRDLDGDGVTDPAWCFTVEASDAASSASSAACTSDYVVAGDWVNLVGVYDPTGSTPRIKLYVNGTPAIGGSYAEADAPATWSAGGPFAVGRAWSAAAPADAWIGDIDEVYGVQRVWSEAEIMKQAIK